MAMRGGTFITQAGKYVLDRVQNVGPGDLNIPEEKIKETGNWESVETVYDTAELQYQVESYDTSCEFECALIGEDADTFPTTPGSNVIDLRDAMPIDIVSPAKSRRNAYDIVNGAVVPYLTLTSATYRFGVGENSTQSFTLTGDSVYYTPGIPLVEEIPLVDEGPYTLDETADLFEDPTGDVYVLSVTLCNTTTGTYKRVFFDSEAVLGSPSASDTGYSNNATSFRLPEDYSADYDLIKVTYSSSSATVSYTQDGNNPHGETVHRTASVLPGAVKGKNIEVYIGSTDATPVFSKLSGVQNFEINWQVTLENDEELGSSHYTASEYDVPEVTGTMGVLPFDPADMMDKLVRITGVTAGNVIGPLVNVAVPVEIRVNHPRTNARLKTFYVPDARFTVPGFNVQVDSKFEQSLPYSSDTGVLYIYNGARTA